MSAVCLYGPAYNDYSRREGRRSALNIREDLITAVNCIHAISIVYLQQGGGGRNETDRPAALSIKVEGNLRRFFFLSLKAFHVKF